MDELLERVRATSLLPATGGVIVMLSGGRDSVCLLDVAVAICGPASVRALHVNYHLRGAESDEDERHCEWLCRELGVELAREHAAWPGASAGNLQAWARTARYAAATRLAGCRRAAVATGHTATDQVETVLYRLAASPGRRALQGMPARDGRLVRPLLGVSREETAAYCRARSLPWREDASNSSERFARARVRAGLAPALRAVHPGAEANVLRTAALLREETELLDGLVDAELERMRAHVCAGESGIPVEPLKALPPALQRLIVIRLAEEAAGTFVPQAGERVAEILELAARAGRRGRAELHVGGLAAAVLEGGMLRMSKLPPRDQGCRQ